MMKKSMLALVATGVFSVLVVAAPAFAADVTPGKAPTADSGSASRSIGTLRLKAAKAKPVPGINVDRSATRAFDLDPAASARAFTLIGRSSDGKDIKLEPGQNVLDAIEKEKAAGDKRTSIEGGGEDPAAGTDGQAREIVGKDGRVQITNTTKFPFSTIGYLFSYNENDDNSYYSCTASVIGPKTILTAGHCLYDHASKNGWSDVYAFCPGINGEDNMPFGCAEYDSAYVFQAFVTDYDGSYDAVWQYDVGLVTFKEEIGNTVGWLGYTNGASLGDFQGNLVGYHNDKPAFTMWRSTCNVIAEENFETDFSHDCDFVDGAQGAPIYFLDGNKDRIIAGVNIGPSGQANWALKLYGPIYEWINTINK